MRYANSRRQRDRLLIGCAALIATLFAAGAQAQTAYRWVDQQGKVHFSDQPPPAAEARNVQKQRLKAASVVETSGPGYDTKQAMREFPLTLYTSENCKEACKSARDFLTQRAAPYTEKVVRTAVDADEFRKATGSEELRVPVLMAGKKLEKGFEPGAWRNLLDAAGYP